MENLESLINNMLEASEIYEEKFKKIREKNKTAINDQVKKLGEIESKLEEIKKNKSTAKEQINKLNKEKEELKIAVTEITEMIDSNKKSSEELLKIKEKMKIVHTDFVDIDEKWRRLNDELKSLDIVSDDIRYLTENVEILKNSENRVAQLSNDIDRFDKDLSKSKNTLETIKNEINKQNLSKNSTKNMFVEYTNKMKELENDYKEFDKRLSSTINKWKLLKAQHKTESVELNNDLEGFLSKMSSLAKEINKLQEKNNRLELSSKTIGDEISGHNKDILKAEEEIKEIKKEISNLDTFINNSVETLEKYFGKTDRLVDILKTVKTEKKKISLLTFASWSFAMFAGVVTIIGLIV